MRRIAKGCSLVNVAVMVVLLLVACDSVGGQLDKAVLFKTAFANMRQLKSYHIESSSSNYYGQSSEVGDVDVSNQRAQLHPTYYTLGGSNNDMTLIYANGHWYGRDNERNDGKYYADGDCDALGIGMPLDKDPYSFTAPWDTYRVEDVERASHELNDASSSYQQIDGVDTHILTVDGKYLHSSGAVDIPVNATISFWISTDAYPTVRRMETHGSTPTDSVMGGLTSVSAWSKINEPVNIAIPTNTVKCPPLPTYPPITPSPLPTLMPTAQP